MAVSEDTAAIVAGQLTVAWATLVAPAAGRPANNSATEQGILARYEKFKSEVLAR